MADVKAHLSVVLDDVRSTHERVEMAAGETIDADALRRLLAGHTKRELRG